MPASFRRLIRSAGPMLRAWSTSAAREAGVAALAIVAFGAAIAEAPDWLVFTLALLPLAATAVRSAGNSDGCRSAGAVSSPPVLMCCLGC